MRLLRWKGERMAEHDCPCCMRIGGGVTACPDCGSWYDPTVYGVCPECGGEGRDENGVPMRQTLMREVMRKLKSKEVPDER